MSVFHEVAAPFGQRIGPMSVLPRVITGARAEECAHPVVAVSPGLLGTLVVVAACFFLIRIWVLFIVILISVCPTPWRRTRVQVRSGLTTGGPGPASAPERQGEQPAGLGDRKFIYYYLYINLVTCTSGVT